MTRNGPTQPRRTFGQGVDNEPPAKLTTAAELARQRQQPAAIAATPSAEKPRATPVEIPAIYDGWTIVLKPELTSDQIPKYLAKLESLGFHRPAHEIPRTPNGEPYCPRHGVPMTEHEKQGDTWFSHKVTDAQGRECWCKGRPGGDSAGWSL